MTVAQPTPAVTWAAGAKVLEATGEGFRDEDYKRATKREIIVRMLRNLVGAGQPDESPGERLAYVDLIVALVPDSVPDRLNRARLRLQTGDVPGAKEDFKWLVIRWGWGSGSTTLCTS